MAESALTTEQVLEVLRQTPTRIATVTAPLTPAQLCTSPRRGEWSANEVLAHLRACGDVWGTNMRTIASQDKPTIRAVNPRSWIKRTDYLDWEFRRSLRAFSRQRAELLTMLESLHKEQWLRSATIIGGGPARTRTVLFYAQWLARHERPHMRQIERIVRTVLS